MKLPPKAPQLNEYSQDEMFSLFEHLPTSEYPGMANVRKYLHWDKVRFLTRKDGVEPKIGWGAVKLSRISNLVALPIEFYDLNSRLKYWQPTCVTKLLHRLDRDAGGFIGISDTTNISESDKERYLLNALIEEAIASSQLEGATTTRVTAKKMLRQKRSPKDRSETMIYNNYTAISELRDKKNVPLSSDFIVHIQEMITKNTLEKPEYAGAFRNSNDVVVVDSTTGESIHTPPPHTEIAKRLDSLCQFIKSVDEDRVDFIHPIIVASLIHFTIGFIHPFHDGNGRTARALFYWYMLRSGYWLFEYLPISREILNGPIKYARAYLYTETDDGDLTYFIYYLLNVVERSIEGTHNYILEQQEIRKKSQAVFKDLRLNARQYDVAGKVLADPTYSTTVVYHSSEYRVSRNTARHDLEDLVEKGVLEYEVVSTRRIYVSSMHLKRQIMKGRLIPKQKSRSPEYDERRFDESPGQQYLFRFEDPREEHGD